ncbi:MAG TPA: GNAT family N-acetyltransferase [Thermomicrobiales bacterium]|nr:GNAT family N-acetyltransferase [Thermomicrobiales bacterium]
MTLPTLETPRLILRTIAPDDRDAIVAILSDKVAMEHMHYASWDTAQCHGWVDTALEIAGQPEPEGIGWVIERKDTGETIGWFGIGNPSHPANAHHVSFEYALGRPNWNQGFMTEVLRCIFTYAFDTLGVPQLTANCHPTNVASSTVMEKAGMRFTHADRAIGMGGYRQHQNHYCITRSDWNGLKNGASS